MSEPNKGSGSPQTGLGLGDGNIDPEILTNDIDHGFFDDPPEATSSIDIEQCQRKQQDAEAISDEESEEGKKVEGGIMMTVLPNGKKIDPVLTGIRRVERNDSMMTMTMEIDGGKETLVEPKPTPVLSKADFSSMRFDTSFQKNWSNAEIILNNGGSGRSSSDSLDVARELAGENPALTTGNIVAAAHGFINGVVEPVVSSSRGFAAGLASSDLDYYGVSNATSPNYPRPVQFIQVEQRRRSFSSIRRQFGVPMSATYDDTAAFSAGGTLESSSQDSLYQQVGDEVGRAYGGSNDADDEGAEEDDEMSECSLLRNKYRIRHLSAGSEGSESSDSELEQLQGSDREVLVGEDEEDEEVQVEHVLVGKAVEYPEYPHQLEQLQELQEPRQTPEDIENKIQERPETENSDLTNVSPLSSLTSDPGGEQQKPSEETEAVTVKIADMKIANAVNTRAYAFEDDDEVTSSSKGSETSLRVRDDGEEAGTGMETEGLSSKAADIAYDRRGSDQQRGSYGVMTDRSNERPKIPLYISTTEKIIIHTSPVELIKKKKKMLSFGKGVINGAAAVPESAVGSGIEPRGNNNDKDNECPDCETEKKMQEEKLSEEAKRAKEAKGADGIDTGARSDSGKASSASLDYSPEATKEEFFSPCASSSGSWGTVPSPSDGKKEKVRETGRAGSSRSASASSRAGSSRRSGTRSRSTSCSRANCSGGRRTPKNYSFTSEQMRKIERDNLILFRKIMDAHSRRTSVYSHQIQHSRHRHGCQTPTSSACIARMKQLKQIECENNMIMKRLQNAKPSKEIEDAFSSSVSSSSSSNNSPNGKGKSFGKN